MNISTKNNTGGPAVIRATIFMAYEALFKHVDELAKEYTDATKKNRSGIEYLIALSSFYSTVLAMPKFKSQRLYCRKVITEICPAYAEGYFGK